MVQTLDDITSEPANLTPLDVSVTIAILEGLLDEAASNSSVSHTVQSNEQTFLACPNIVYLFCCIGKYSQVLATFLNVVNNILEVNADTMSAAIQSANSSAR